MGLILEQTPKMGEYHGEVRRESFYLAGEHNWEEDGYIQKPHGIYVYENGDCGQGTAEILIEDIPKVRAVIDAVEQHVKGSEASPQHRYTHAEVVQAAEDAIGLFIEYRDQYGYSEEDAKVQALAEVKSGTSPEVYAELSEADEMRRRRSE